MRGRVIRKFWGIVPITAQDAITIYEDAITIYEADKDALLYLTDGGLPSRDSALKSLRMTVSVGGPICFCVLLKSQ